jgi:bifunctional DNA-binding transcriptional regulator/antitoxin component of YhaV-PrlF toxin-antitoxin module
MITEAERLVWEWLPGRTDNRRVTMPATIANALGLPVQEVVAAIARMDRDGHVIRNSATGRQSGWHRGKPLPAVTEPEAPEEWHLF